MIRPTSQPLSSRSSKDDQRPRLLIAQTDATDRAGLVQLCQRGGSYDELTTAESGTEALNKIRSNRPDAALLDCELTDMTAFDLLQSLRDDERPPAILVAPDGRYALQAFESGAIDYITKPIHVTRLGRALQRARRVCCAGDAVRSGERAIGNAEVTVPMPPPLLNAADLLVGERGGRLYFLSASEIDYIESAWNYVTLQTGKHHYITRDSLKRLTPLLVKWGFIRISRSVAVNLHRVGYAEREGRGVLGFVLRSGTRLVSSTGYRIRSGAELRVERNRET